jgi:hypothetical protein
LKYKISIFLTLIIQCFSSIAALEKIQSSALSMVPKGEFMERGLREITVKTQAGTKIKIDFLRQGQFKKASGLNLNRGDEFEPGQGLLSLGSVAQSLALRGHQVRGEWNLEKDQQDEWLYELVEEAVGEKTYHFIHARNGKLMESIELFQ